MPRQQKPWISLGQQLELLTDRGMTIDEPEIARSYLEKLGYYRLSGYWYPFRKISTHFNQELDIPIRYDEFINGSHFRDIVDLYIFDKRLRLHALDALERIEMAVRVDIAHLLGEIDCYAHENPKCLHGRFSKQAKKKGPEKGKTEHQVWLEKYERAIWRARREPFIEHYKKNYEGIPIWVAIEVWDFGMMSMLYSGMKVQHQDKIAEKYGAPSGHDFSKWLRSLNFIRNVCAHHSRLWNINVLERAPVPHYEHWQKINNSRPFFYFCLMQKLLAVISPNSTWNKRFDTIVESFPEPENNAIKISEFGVVDNWESWPVWGLK
ncbi:MAG: abortive phage resistance protein [Idiomarinaceae bacterium]|nr:abortive phage resistance protein [Idiomarinaceae bacterium]